MLTKEPETLQTMRFVSTMQQNVTAAPLKFGWRQYSASPDPPAGFKGSLHGVKGRRRGRRGGAGREGKER